MHNRNRNMAGADPLQHFLGVVMDNKDPQYKGRCKVKVFGLFDELETQDLPWAFPRNEISFGADGGSGRFSTPKLGSIVHIQFNNGDYYSPEYKALQELSQDLIEEIKTSYEGAHSVIFDGIENVRVYYTVAKGLTMDVKDSTINIANDNSITIQHKDAQSMIELRGGKITENADSEIEATAVTRIKHSSNEFWADGKTTKLGHTPVYSAVLHEPLWLFLKQLAAGLDAKLVSTPGTFTALAETYEQLSKSDVVKVSKI
jgi:hypothetical protein